MTRHPVERAFELAKSGSFSSIEDLREQLIAENFDNVHGHLVGSLRRQLIVLIAKSRQAS
ncbi:hypothetical protein D3Y57_00700 (plasmid) [Sphingomonas paeninsulae]|uniref:Uncharacterized protein n=1 Tax=Sphingomonas paeninsulae TaxID=2319844 RepID=A0A494TFI4_SPHPE|nr:hypothetical protein [Sphingomonas paeninsulae]AYJ84656.1 hypothetical protein D3Y57_00700 [Sphingomonas paeninsulae]